MPRRPDPELENRILKAAHKLWKKGGEKSLTLRAVAKAAGTNTPAVYRRFRDRDDIVRGLLRRIRLEIAEALEQGETVERSCEHYLDYALTHPHEYELFFRHNYELCHSPRARRMGFSPVDQPARAVMRQKLAKQLAGPRGSHERLLVALWMLGHGAASLLIDKSILPEEANQARRVFSEAVAALVKRG
ncbi:MAG TPA: TetR/AcrR family transcriptional regulator [Candidatus Binatia bacterium]|nr:TetR/AcrR family transcriptional regulator [Candidatus Binatia bacterium]